MVDGTGSVGGTYSNTRTETLQRNHTMSADGCLDGNAEGDQADIQKIETQTQQPTEKIQKSSTYNIKPAPN